MSTLVRGILRRATIRHRRFIIIVLPAVLISLAYISAFLLIFDSPFDRDRIMLIAETLALLLIIRLTVFAHFKLFHGLWRYVSLSDLVTSPRRSQPAPSPSWQQSFSSTAIAIHGRSSFSIQ